MTSKDVFLSYNRDDQATARRFAEAFEHEGFSVWWDQTLRSGEAYDEVTESAALRRLRVTAPQLSMDEMDGHGRGVHAAGSNR